MKKKWPIGATHLPPAQIPSQAFSQVRVRKGLGEQSASIGVREGGVVYKGRANVRGGSQKGVQSRGRLPGPEPLGAHSCQLAAPSGSTPGCPEIGLRLTRHPPQEASASSLSGFPHLPGFRLSPFCLLPPRQNSIQTVSGGKGAQERQLGGCVQLLSGPLPEFFSIPGTEAHLAGEQSLAASGPTAPGGKPWVLDINRPEREKASCWGGTVPCSYTRGFPNPQDFRKKGAPPTDPPCGAPRGHRTGGKLLIM